LTKDKIISKEKGSLKLSSQWRAKGKYLNHLEIFLTLIGLGADKNPRAGNHGIFNFCFWHSIFIPLLS
jgi:hypothetical protein